MLELSIGANTAIFSIFDQMLLRALPVQEPDRLVNLAAPGPKPGSQSCNQAGDCDEEFSYPMFRDLERAQTVFTGFAAHCLFNANLGTRSEMLNDDGPLAQRATFRFSASGPRWDGCWTRRTTASSASRMSSS